MLVGAHVSVAKGYTAALDYAESVGCECLQLFAKSPRQWRGPATDLEAARAFISERAARRFGPVFTHTAYLINPTTDDPELREKSIAALADELVRGARLGVDGVVTHLGNDPGGDSAEAARRCADALVRAFDAAGDEASAVRLLIENTAGAGRTFGGSLEELAAVIAATGLPTTALGVCLDTCHAFAFGYPLDSAQGWRALLDEFEALLGIERLGLVHANDCLFERGSHRDRHAWIGDGLIGGDGFAAMMCEPRLRTVPAVTEMPGEVPVKDATNVARLIELREACAPSH